MQDDLSRRVRIDGLVVTRVVDQGLVARAQGRDARKKGAVVCGVAGSPKVKEAT